MKKTLGKKAKIQDGTLVAFSCSCNSLCSSIPDDENAWQRKPVKSRVCGT